MAAECGRKGCTWLLSTQPASTWKPFLLIPGPEFGSAYSRAGKLIQSICPTGRQGSLAGVTCKAGVVEWVTPWEVSEMQDAKGLRDVGAKSSRNPDLLGSNWGSTIYTA